MIAEGTEVRHVSDPHGRWKGEVIGHITRRMGFGMFGRGPSVKLAQVRWNSGVVETLHESELTVVE